MVLSENVRVIALEVVHRASIVVYVDIGTLRGDREIELKVRLILSFLVVFEVFLKMAEIRVQGTVASIFEAPFGAVASKHGLALLERGNGHLRQFHIQAKGLIVLESWTARIFHFAVNLFKSFHPAQHVVSAVILKRGESRGDGKKSGLLLDSQSAPRLFWRSHGRSSDPRLSLDACVKVILEQFSSGVFLRRAVEQNRVDVHGSWLISISERHWAYRLPSQADCQHETREQAQA